ncbi:MAG: SOS response-associated peptidase [Gemmatimonadota bacterium]
MCARATLTVSADDLEETFGHEVPTGYRPSFNLAPTQPLLVLSERDDGVVFQHVRWGLVPFWADDESIGRRLINGRSETVATKPAFRAAYAKRRCLVVVDGFYEWQRAPDGKRPHRIRMRSCEPFTLAAIWERWERGPEPLETCAVLTTAANALMAPIHDRMPVVVASADRAAWLGAEASRERLGELLRPYPGDELEAYEVSTLMNNPRRNEPACITPVDPPLSLL